MTSDRRQQRDSGAADAARAPTSPHDSVCFALDHVAYGYGRKDPVFRNVSLRIPAGKNVVILGPSGVGKSTLLYLLGLLWEGPLRDGCIRYSRGLKDHSSLSSAERAHLRLNRFGFVLQSSYLLPHFTCVENVAMPLAFLGVNREEREQRAVELMLEAAPNGDLIRIKSQPSREVSGGQRQRMAVLRAVIHGPSVLFADEPFSSLDRENSELIVSLLNRWRLRELVGDRGVTGERTLIMVCHDAPFAARYGDYFLLFRRHHGQVSITLVDRDSLPADEHALAHHLEESCRQCPISGHSTT